MITGDSKISGRTAHPTFTSPKVRLTWNSPKCSRPASAGLAEPFRAPRMRRIQVLRGFADRLYRCKNSACCLLPSLLAEAVDRALPIRPRAAQPESICCFLRYAFQDDCL